MIFWCLRIIKSQYLNIRIPPMRTAITMTPALPPALSTAMFTLPSASINWFAEMFVLLHILILTKKITCITLNRLRSIYMHCNGYTSIYKDIYCTNTFREKRNISLKRRYTIVHWSFLSEKKLEITQWDLLSAISIYIFTSKS